MVGVKVGIDLYKYRSTLRRGKQELIYVTPPSKRNLHAIIPH